MTAITKVRPSLVSPAGAEVSDAGYAKTDIAAGDPIVIVADTPPSRRYDCVVQAATGTTGHAIAVVDVKAGGLAEFAAEGEIDGYAGLTPGSGLTIVGGKIDDTAPGAGVVAQIRAITPSRIRFSLI